MILNREKVKAHICELLATLDYLTDDKEANPIHYLHTVRRQLCIDTQIRPMIVTIGRICFLDPNY